MLVDGVYVSGVATGNGLLVNSTVPGPGSEWNQLSAETNAYHSSYLDTGLYTYLDHSTMSGCQLMPPYAETKSQSQVCPSENAMMSALLCPLSDKAVASTLVIQRAPDSSTGEMDDLERCISLEMSPLSNTQAKLLLKRHASTDTSKAPGKPKCAQCQTLPKLLVSPNVPNVRHFQSSW